MSDRWSAKVLDHGIVAVDDFMGDDLTIVNAAQASLDRQSHGYGPREKAILLKLMSEEHGVPFEHVVMRFKLRLPIFLARQFVKHRMGSWSEHSARYSEIEPLFYVPGAESIRTQVGSAMSYTYEPLEPSYAGLFQFNVRRANRVAYEAYEDSIRLGVAKEQARMVLPVNTYTTVVWTLNARSLFNFLRLRADPHAQAEAQVYAVEMERLATLVIPDTMQAFVAAGRPKV